MTREEVLKMPAGREMDALIAVNVMGWKYNSRFLLPPKDHPASINNWCAEWDDYGRPNWLPRFSTDIAAAWEVVEKFDNRVMINNVHGQYTVYFERTSGASSKSCQLAICRAALLAVME